MPSSETPSLQRLNAHPIKPFYWQSSPNEEIVLTEFNGSISTGGETRQSHVAGRAIVRFMPEPSLDFETNMVPEDPNSGHPFGNFAHFHSNNATLRVSPSCTPIDVFCKSASLTSSVFVPKCEPVWLNHSSSQLSQAVFHLMNWPKFLGSTDYILTKRTPTHEGVSRLGFLEMQFGPWAVSVAATEQTSIAVQLLKEKGGLVITHVGAIRRTDSEVFSKGELDDLLTFLRFLFSFCLGCWNSPFLSVGLDASENRICEEWGVGCTHDGSWSASTSWFDCHHPNMISELADGFWKMWSSDVWRETLHKAIYWYINGNQCGPRLGVDSAILFTQAALELLSWTYCVLDRQMISEEAFGPRRLNAADKLRLLASSLSIPLEIPAELRSLHGKPGKKWNDSMQAITDVRNSLVHPGSNQPYLHGTYYDAWRLSMWYLDLIVLRLCGYRGKYGNRLADRWMGQVEPVPWK